VLQKVPVTEKLRVENVRGKLFVGNPAGLCYANYKVDQAALRARVDAQDNKIALRDIKISSMNGPTSSLNAYELLRIGLSVLSNVINWETQPMQIGGHLQRAHGGDAAVAQLYEGVGGRKDTKAFKELYGMFPGEVRMISRFFAILKKCRG
jgi:hypothetical protein